MLMVALGHLHANSMSSQHALCHMPRAVLGALCVRRCSLLTTSVGTILTHLTEGKPFAQDRSGSEQCSRFGWFWDLVVGSAGRWLWRTVCSAHGGVTCALPGSGSPQTGGSSCLPVMTRLSSYGTRRAGSVSTLTVSMAGKSPDPVLLLQMLKKSMDLGMKGPQWPYVGPRLCFSLSLNFFLCEREVQSHPHPHK